MNKLSQDKYKLVEIMTRYNVDLNKTSVEDFISQMLDHVVPFLQTYNANITKVESLSKEEQDAIFDNWDKASIELNKALDSVREKGGSKNESEN